MSPLTSSTGRSYFPLRGGQWAQVGAHPPVPTDTGICPRRDYLEERFRAQPLPQSLGSLPPLFLLIGLGLGHPDDVAEQHPHVSRAEEEEVLASGVRLLLAVKQASSSRQPEMWHLRIGTAIIRASVCMSQASVAHSSVRVCAT